MSLQFTDTPIVNIYAQVVTQALWACMHHDNVGPY